MLGRQSADDVEFLGVEQDQETGDPVGGRVGVVVQQPSRVGPAPVLVEWPGGAGPAGCRGGEPGRGPAGQPLVEIGLIAGGQGRSSGVQPVQEGGSAGDLSADVVDLLVGSGLTGETATEAAQVMPDRVGV